MLTYFAVVKFEGTKHCIHCPLRNREDDGCTLQEDGNGRSVEFHSWQEQMKGCSLIPGEAFKIKGE